MMSEGFILFLWLVYFVGGILGVILFFKIWGMTNNVARIRELLENQLKGDSVAKENVGVSCDSFNVGDKVVILKSGKVSFVTEVNGDKYECSSNNGNFYDGTFRANELHKF